jgi:hypothetical protein
VPHLWKLLLFAGLNFADLLLTWNLVSHGEGDIYEGNPIAQSWLTLYGWAGLALFKLVVVLVVASLVFIISRYRPRLGGLVLGFGCCAVCVVVAYGCYLVGQEYVQGYRDTPSVPERAVAASRHF